MKHSPHELIELPIFHALVRKRWTMSFFLLFLLFFTYYGYISLIAFKRDLMIVKVGGSINIGLVLAELVILFSWILTLIYVNWANMSYDKDVDHLKTLLKEEKI